jgi:ArsR family transcriptional regulator
MKIKSEMFKALGDPTRLKIVELIANEELCVCKIHEEFELSQPTISHHMKILENAGIVVSRRDGKWTRYSLDSLVMGGICEYIQNILEK